jgi:lipoprotein-anchoring transpeptidase ErfK/SrfK
MKLCISAWRATGLLAAAVLWIGSAGAAPLSSYPSNSGELFDAAMRRPDQVQPTEMDVDRDSDLQRQVVSYLPETAAGTVVVDTANTYLYFVLGNGKAIRYGIGVGRDGYAWSGAQSVSRKAEWPDWTPPTEMLARQPYLPRWMAGGETNPLGARAIYLGETVYRIHGTNMPSSIGKKVSSGCIRMLNEDVIDLYNRIGVGTKVVVLRPATAGSAAAPAARIAARRTTELRAVSIY